MRLPFAGMSGPDKTRWSMRLASAANLDGFS
jgi:hypothetical protein